MEEEIISFDHEKCLEELKCPICFKILEDPVMELPNEHIMCRKCLFKFNKKLSQEPLKEICPICRIQIKEIIKPRFIINILNLVEMKCLSHFQNESCDWKGNAIDYYEHLKICEISKKQKKEEIKKICDKMREIINREITPHLKNNHSDIFNTYVKEWEWLEEDNRDWKWWWWCNNPWWENKSCKECNELWHKYENEVQIFESQRICKLTN